MNATSSIIESESLVWAAEPAVFRPREVFKFGGTSVGSPERLARVVEIVARAAADAPIVVVVSAMQHTTDLLVELARAAAEGREQQAQQQIDALSGLWLSNAAETAERIGAWAGERASSSSLDADGGGARGSVAALIGELRRVVHGVCLVGECSAASLDQIMSFGERVSAVVVAVLLRLRGVPALAVDARGFIRTDDHFGAAQVDTHATDQLLRAESAAWNGSVPVVTGFIGKSVDGRTTTLGRNGSDYTATLLARGLGAREVVVWTDVSGVMTADPAIVSDAYPLSHLSYGEALELVDYGASMFHPRTLIPLIEADIPLCIRNTLRPEDPGTRIDANGGAKHGAATSVTSREQLALLGVQVRRMEQQAEIASRVLRALHEAKVAVWMATQAAHGQAVAVVVPRTDCAHAQAAIREALALELQRGEVEAPQLRSPVTLLSLVGEGLASTAGVAGRFFGALGAIGTEVRAIGQGASARSISCVVDADATTPAVRAVHAAFNLAHEEVSLFVLGKGSVGGALLEQIRSERERLQHEHGIRLRVVGIADRERSTFQERGVALDHWREELAFGGGSPRLESGGAAWLLEKLRRLPVPVLVDCSSATTGVEGLYRDAFCAGIHVVTANKRPLTADARTARALHAAAREAHREYRYETTVGASLPVIGTLKNLVRTGDEVRLIDGAFSGTLGFVLARVLEGVPLSRAVREAREKGYTETHPRDDLSGLDCARKALILARELGHGLDLDDIEVEPFVPAELLASEDPETFLDGLAAHDAAFAEQVDRHRREGEAPCYLARLAFTREGRGVKPHVGLCWLGAGHPAARLRGRDAQVAFTTARYATSPLVIQGAGAGGEVTAAGVLADILDVASSLRAR